MWRFLKKLEIELPHHPAIPLLGIHTEETRIERDTCTPMFIAALFTIAKTWKQPRCSLADEWIRKLWYINTMEYSIQSLCKAVWRFLKKLGIKLPYDPGAISLLGIYPEETKIEKDTCIPLFLQ